MFMTVLLTWSSDRAADCHAPQGFCQDSAAALIQDSAAALPQDSTAAQSLDSAATLSQDGAAALAHCGHSRTTDSHASKSMKHVPSLCMQ